MDHAAAGVEEAAAANAVALEAAKVAVAAEAADEGSQLSPKNQEDGNDERKITILLREYVLLQAERHMLRKRTADLTAEVNQLLHQVNSEMPQLRANDTAFTSQIALLQSSKASLCQRVEELTAENARLVTANKALEDEVAALKREVTELRSRIAVIEPIPALLDAAEALVIIKEKFEETGLPKDLLFKMPAARAAHLVLNPSHKAPWEMYALAHPQVNNPNVMALWKKIYGSRTAAAHSRGRASPGAIRDAARVLEWGNPESTEALATLFSDVTM